MLPVVITTHNRTAVASKVVSSLIENLSGDQFYWILSDDRSKEGHVEVLQNVFRKYGCSYKILESSVDSYGLGASMNRGLRLGFSMSDIALRTEDDWLLTRKFDVREYAEFLREKGSCIRLGMMYRSSSELKPIGNDLSLVRSNPSRLMTFNNQVALVHRRVYEKIGFYPENVKPNEVESQLARRFNECTNRGREDGFGVYWPSKWPTNVEHHKDLPFCHIGDSTIGHKYNAPREYKFLNSESLDEALRKSVLADLQRI